MIFRHPSTSIILISLLIAACSSKSNSIVGAWVDDSGNKIEIHKTLEDEYQTDIEFNQYDVNLIFLADACSDKITLVTDAHLSCNSQESAQSVDLIYSEESDSLELQIGHGVSYEYFNRQIESK